MERIRVFFYNHQRLFYLIQYMVFSLFLIAFVYFADYRFIRWKITLPDIFTTSVDLSTTILSTLAGSLLTITTFTFTSILSVISIQVSNYSSYIVPNFINKPIVMKVLGVFLGGFLYCISSLALMRDIVESRQVISGMIGILYAIVCVIYFIAFIRQVLYYSQDRNIIEDVYQESKKSIDRELSLRTDSHTKIETTYQMSFPLYTVNSGYYSVLDGDEIANELGDYKGQMVVSRRVGDFLPAGTEIAKVYILDEEVSEEDIDKETLQNAFVLVNEEITRNNYRYGLNKLVEIAMRSLAPNTPDNDTAIHCIHKLGLLLADLGSKNYYHNIKKREGHFNIFNSSYSFKDDLYTVFSQIIHYGKDDLFTMVSLIDTCLIIYDKATNANKAIVKEAVAYIKEKLDPIYENEIDRQYLEFSFEKFDDAVESNKSRGNSGQK